MNKKLITIIGFVALLVIVSLFVIDDPKPKIEPKVVNTEEITMVSEESNVEEIEDKQIPDSTENTSIEVNYEPTVVSVDEYKEYMSYADTLCPFVTTASTGMCLDGEIKKQIQYYDLLSKEILTKTNIESEQAKMEDKLVDLVFISHVLEWLPEYTKIKDEHIGWRCAIKNILTTGTAIVEESLKCAMYYNHKDIQVLESIVDSF